jgi:hypothetical protein
VKRRKEEKTVILIDIEIEKVTCGYCGKPNHTAEVCWKKTVDIKITLKRTSREKIVLQVWVNRTWICKFKKIVSLTNKIKISFTYLNSIKLKKRKEVVRKVDSTKFLRELTNYPRTIVTQHINHESTVMCKKNQESHTLQSVKVTI